MSTVAIENLHVRLGGADILKDLSLQVARGEFLVLLGPSGCGKSTLLHAIAGLLDVHDGIIRIGEQDVTWSDPKDRSIGMVFQSYALYPTMTVERNLSFGPRIAGVPRDEIARRVARASGMLQLGGLLQRKPAHLSGGQRQRVAIGRALVRDASVFLFDEPLSNLDAKLRAELRRELKQLHKDLGTTMIYVTHDQVEAMTLASRIAVMKAGSIQQIDTPAAVYERPLNMFVAGFLGAPSMNFIAGRIAAAAPSWRFESPALACDLSSYAFAAAPQAGQPAVLGVRPEHITLVDGEAPRCAGRATVSLIEPLGANEIVWLDAQGQTIALQTDIDSPAAVDQSVGFSVAGNRVSLFDATTQARL